MIIAICVVLCVAVYGMVGLFVGMAYHKLRLETEEHYDCSNCGAAGIFWPFGIFAVLSLKIAIAHDQKLADEDAIDLMSEGGVLFVRKFGSGVIVSQITNQLDEMKLSKKELRELFCVGCVEFVGHSPSGSFMYRYPVIARTIRFSAPGEKE